MNEVKGSDEKHQVRYTSTEATCRRQYAASLGMSLVLSWLPSRRSILILEKFVMSTVLQKLLRENSARMQECSECLHLRGKTVNNTENSNYKGPF